MPILMGLGTHENNKGMDGLFIPVPKGMKPGKWVPRPEAGTYPDLFWSPKVERSGSDVGLRETTFFSRVMKFLVHASVVASPESPETPPDTMMVPNPRKPRKPQ